MDKFRGMSRATNLRAVEFVDAHAGGDVGKVALAGIQGPPGTVADRARYFADQADGLRRLMITSPYGDPSRSFNLVVEPDRRDADAGVIIMGTMGYPNFSGSNAMCTAAALVESGALRLDEGSGRVSLQTPGGVAPLDVSVYDGVMTAVAYDGLPGFAVPGYRRADIEGWGSVRYRLAYGGVYYAVVDGSEIGLDPAGVSVAETVRFFTAFFDTVAPTLELWHPEFGAMPRLTLGLLVDDLGSTVADGAR